MGVGSGYEDYQRLDYTDLGFQTHVANQCIAFLESGVVDGVLMDWAKNDHAVMFAKVRELIGNDAVLLGNVNHHEHMIDQILPHLSGVYMECGWWSGYGDDPPEFFRRVRETIRKAQETVREPKLICTEVWSERDQQDLDSSSGFLKVASGQEHVLRAGVAVHYTHTSGYYSFYPQTFRDVYLAEHMHIYHDFFNAHLGDPIPGAPTLENGAYKKDWEKGTVVFNPPENSPYTITFPELRKSQATKAINTTHTVPAYDGDIFLKGTYDQIYPDVKDYPDTTYKNTFPVATAPKSRISPQPGTRLVTITPIMRNQQILLQKQEEGKAPQYFNTKGRQMKALEKTMR